MIDWKEGSVCFARGRQWGFSDRVKPYSLACCSNGDASLETLSSVINFKDFQLNEIRQSDYIEASEIDTEKKYSDAVAVFGLFGFKRNGRHCSGYELFVAEKDIADVLVAYNTLDKDNNTKLLSANRLASYCKRKITYTQLMAIGKLKRAMIEREMAAMNEVKPLKILKRDWHVRNWSKCYTSRSGAGSVTSNGGVDDKRNKSKQAYDILKTLDYEYDLVKQRWYKKEWA